MIDEHEVVPEPGIGLALLTVFGIIATIAVLSVLIWALMLGVAATTAGRHEKAPATGQMVIDQKALPAKQPPSPARP